MENLALLGKKVSKIEDMPHNLKWFLDDSHGEMCTVVDQPGYIILGHFWQLLLEYTFEASKYNETLPCVIVVNDPEFDLAIALLDNGGLRRG